MSNAAFFGERLRQLREAASLTQQQLAESVGCTWESISRWERGTREPGWSQVLALAQALGVDCTAFTQEPSTEATEPRKPGRPRKTPEAGEMVPVSEEPAPAPEPTPEPAPAKKPRKRKSP